MSDKKGRKFLKGVFIALGIIVVALIAAFFVFVLYAFTGGPAKVTEDVAKYEETMRKYTEIHPRSYGQSTHRIFYFPACNSSKCF